MLTVNEIFHSIQGESSHAGLPCVFVRLTGCHLRCSWCDSEFSFYEGTRRLVDDVLHPLGRFEPGIVEIGHQPPHRWKSLHIVCNHGTPSKPTPFPGATGSA